MKTLLATASALALITFSPVEAADMNTAAANPLLVPWTGPYGGVPAFAEV